MNDLAASGNWPWWGSRAVTPSTAKMTTLVAKAILTSGVARDIERRLASATAAASSGTRAGDRSTRIRLSPLAGGGDVARGGFFRLGALIEPDRAAIGAGQAQAPIANMPKAPRPPGQPIFRQGLGPLRQPQQRHVAMHRVHHLVDLLPLGVALRPPARRNSLGDALREASRSRIQRFVSRLGNWASSMKANVMPMMTVRRRRGLLISVASQPRRQYVHAVIMKTMLNASGTSSAISGPRANAKPAAAPASMATTA